ncbi:Hypothetical protein GLP15_3059 [Giardia lamblia P15]|uniref:Uncharacterized protein n=1 Tax=Giardia intestinalis (strain P15) TaxID=658858 RepID=E1F936_GIAIA|nr:Hypothetical protein GLP15_3059 [Giardia lamblia P15]
MIGAEGDASDHESLPSLSFPVRASSAALYALVSQVVGPVLDTYVDQTRRCDAENNLRLICSTSFRERPCAVHQRLVHHTGVGRSASVPLKKSTSDLEDRYRRLKNQYTRLRNLLLEVLAREQAVTTLSREPDMLVNYMWMGGSSVNR